MKTEKTRERAKGEQEQGTNTDVCDACVYVMREETYKRKKSRLWIVTGGRCRYIQCGGGREGSESVQTNIWRMMQGPYGLDMAQVMCSIILKNVSRGKREDRGNQELTKKMDRQGFLGMMASVWIPSPMVSLSGQGKARQFKISAS